MRIRTIKPGFWESQDVAAMDWSTRLIFIGLWSYADDNGVGRDEVALITASLFPYDIATPDGLGDISVKVHRALVHLSTHGQITRYTVENRNYFHIVEWAQHQKIERASKGRYPLPTCTDAQPTLPFTDISPNVHRTLPDMSPVGEGEKGRRGEEVKNPPPSRAAARTPPEPRDDVDEICTRLQAAVTANGIKPPTITDTWRRQARLLIDRDGYKLPDILHVLDWALHDPFWQGNVQSVPTFRRQYGRLLLQARAAANGKTANGKPTRPEPVQDWLR